MLSGKRNWSLFPVNFKIILRWLDRPIGKIIVQLLDFPRGRVLLSKLATRVAREQTGSDIEIFYDRLWIHRVGPYFFPDSSRFNYTSSSFPRFKNQASGYLSRAEDFWFQHYIPKRGDTIIDIGAGKGENILAFSQAVGELGRVIAFEANPDSYEILEDFCHRNRLTNTLPLNVAVMDRSGTISMLESKNLESYTVDKSPSSTGIQVQAVALDEICKIKVVTEVAFLKMSIEGAEQYALLGMSSLIKRVRTICVACHDFRADKGDGEQFRTRDFVEQFLIKNGFTLASRPHDPRAFVRDLIFGLR
jgi:FkbM family methyltransferase